jgi:hypothetical protein
MKKEDFVTKTKIAEILKVEKEYVETLRTKHGLPSCEIGKKGRLYYLPDVFEWILSKKQNLGQ